MGSVPACGTAVEVVGDYIPAGGTAVEVVCILEADNPLLKSHDLDQTNVSCKL